MTPEEFEAKCKPRWVRWLPKACLSDGVTLTFIFTVIALALSAWADYEYIYYISHTP